MKSTLFFLYVLVSCCSFSQMTLEKSLRKLGLTEETAVRSKEKVDLYPRGLIYSKKQPDSVGYLSCLSSDQNDFRLYFEERDIIICFSASEIMQRQIEDFMETFAFETLNNKSAKLFTKGNSENLVDPNANYVFLYYWTPDVLDKYLINNLDYFKKYASKHPALKIQIIPVLVE